MRVLIADDEQIIRFGLKSVLKGLYPKVIISEVENLDSVVSIMTKQNFDLLILDIQMQGGDELENLIQFLMTEVKVVIFSGYEPTNPRIKSLRKAGVDQFIFKNASLEEIKLSLREYFPDLTEKLGQQTPN